MSIESFIEAMDVCQFSLIVTMANVHRWASNCSINLEFNRDANKRNARLQGAEATEYSAKLLSSLSSDAMLPWHAGAGSCGFPAVA